MDYSRFTYNLSDLGISGAYIARVIGSHESPGDEYIPGIVESTLSRAADLSDIRGEYRIYKNLSVDYHRGTISVDSQEIFTGMIIASQLRKSSMAAIFLATTGEELANISRSLMEEGDMLAAYIMDVIGSELVESAIESMHNALEEEMAKSGLSVTNRFSPGYCDWDLKSQQYILELMPDNFCGISLTESSLMIPVKSVSGIIGIGKDVSRMPYSCSRCDSENCIYRGRR